MICYLLQNKNVAGKKINSRPEANATNISIGQPILRVAIAQLATYKIYLVGCLRCQSHSEYIIFNYVESLYSLEISFRTILCFLLFKQM